MKLAERGNDAFEYAKKLGIETGKTPSGFAQDLLAIMERVKALSADLDAYRPVLVTVFTMYLVLQLLIVIALAYALWQLGSIKRQLKAHRS